IEIILLFHHKNSLRLKRIIFTGVFFTKLLLQKSLDFIKVKGNSDNYFNNYIDELIAHTDETSNLVFKANNHH
ncbi:hypothetical protein RhiirC2_770398, partial [Rhizophagus irregularis]